MVEILTYAKPKDFLNKNRDYIYGDYFSHYHLIHTIENLKRGKTGLFDCFNIIDDAGSDVLCMWVTGAVYMYSRKWTTEVIAKLSERIQLKKFKNFSFCGQRELIKEFFNYNQVEGEIFKNRFIEVCAEVKAPITKFTGQIENGQYDDFDELVEMGILYNQEEFRGKGSKTEEDIAASVESAIESTSIYAWRANGVITSIAQVINDHDEFAAIGSLFTKEEYRGKGYGYFLMHSLTSGLLKNGYAKCGLVSDADNPVTKKIFDKIGYKPIYNWVLINKEDK